MAARTSRPQPGIGVGHLLLLEQAGPQLLVIGADGRFNEAGRLAVADRCEDSGVLGHHIGARVGPLGLPLVPEHPGERFIFVGFGIVAVEAVSMADVPDLLIEVTARNGRLAETDPFLVAALDLGPVLLLAALFAVRVARGLYRQLVEVVLD